MIPLRVTVPCSTSNLGSGFDCIGLALNRHLTATFEPADEGLTLRRDGTLADLGDDTEADLVVRVLADHGITGYVVLDSDIPVGKGLGSSAAARVAALAMVGALRREPVDFEDLLAGAAALEGHPDNAAPAILGGLIAVVSDGTTQRALPLHLNAEVGFAFAAPQSVVSTKAARGALPDQVAHAAATRTVARSIALIEGLAEADPELLRIGFTDELHVPYRIGMIPGGAGAIDAALAAGAWAATVSGSGSGIIAACARGDESAIADAMAHVFEHATGQAALGFAVMPDFSGVQVEALDG